MHWSRRITRHPDLQLVFSSPFITTVGVSLLFVLGVSIVLPALPLVVEHYGLSRGAGGLFLSSFALGRFGFALVGGWIGDRFGIRRTAVGACVIILIGSVIGTTIPSYPMMLGARIMQGVGSSVYNTVAIGHILTLAPNARVGRVVAIFQGTLLAGASVGPAVGGLATEAWGLSGPFVLFAGFALLGGVAATIYMPRAPSIQRTHERRTGTSVASSRAAVAALLSMRSFRLVMLGGFISFFTREGVTNTLLPLLSVERWSFSAAEVGFLLTIASMGQVAAVILAGLIVDRIGRRSTLLLGLWVSVGVLLALASDVPVWLLFIVAAGLGASKGLTGVVPTVVVSDLAQPEDRGTALGFQRTITDLGALLGPVTTGVLIDLFDFSSALVIIACAVAVIGAWTFSMKDTVPREGI